MATTVDLIREQIAAIPNLKKLQSSESPQFKEWNQITLAIIKRKLGKEKADNFPSSFEFWPNRIGPWEDYELKESLINGLESAEAYLNGLIKEIELFGEDDKQNDKNNYSQKPSEIRLGEGGKNGLPGGGGSIFISGQTVNISKTAKIMANGGDVNSTYGDSSPIIINAPKINGLISQLEKEVEENYHKKDKEEVKTIVKELKKQADSGNEGGFKQLAGVLLTKGAEIAQIASLIIQLLTLSSVIR